MKTASDVKNRQTPRCVLCGSDRNVEVHHIAGRNHVAWIMIPLCRAHHVRLTIAIRQAGIDMRYTSDPAERLRRARQAIYACLWFLDEVNPEGAQP
jgi:transposase-like protein